MALVLSLHLLAAALWVGGMFVLLFCVRPAAVACLDPPQRLPLLNQVLARFFPCVWGFVFVLPLTGYWMLFSVFGGLASAGWHIHAMQGIAWVMILLFSYLYFRPFNRLREGVSQCDWPKAASAIGTIKQIVQINLILGIVTLLIASGGRFFA